LDEPEGRVVIDVFGPESPIFQKGLFQRPVGIESSKRLWIGYGNGLAISQRYFEGHNPAVDQPVMGKLGTAVFFRRGKG
jgi:hypothetical protein